MGGIHCDWAGCRFSAYFPHHCLEEARLVKYNKYRVIYDCGVQVSEAVGKYVSGDAVSDAKNTHICRCRLSTIARITSSPTQLPSVAISSILRLAAAASPGS